MGESKDGNEEARERGSVAENCIPAPECGGSRQGTELMEKERWHRVMKTWEAYLGKNQLRE